MLAASLGGMMATICIYGAGSIGCYLGGRLAAAGAEVCFIGRSSIGTELQAHGLTMTHYDGRDWHVPPSAIAFSTGPGAAASAELILVTVKSGATAQAATELAGTSRPDAVVISFQNGIGNADTLRAALPGRIVLAGMVPFNIVKRAPGAFHQASEGEPELEESSALASLLADFDRAGFAPNRHHEMLPVQWAKLLLNLNNAVNALSGLPLQQELAQRDYRRCLALAQAEALALLKQAGIAPARLTPLPPDWIPVLLRLPDALFTRLARKMLAIDPSARSSMADDLAAGRRTEVDWINGEVVGLAQRLGRQAPVNARLVSLVKAAENDGACWSGEALLAELHASAAPG